MAPAVKTRAGDAERRVTANLRSAITTGRFMPNERLVETDLAADFATNRAIVRYALMLLEHEGLVVREPNRGARVRLVPDAEALEITEVRAVLEVLAARQAATRANGVDREALESILRGMQSAFAQSDLISLSAINGRLHHRIQSVARNRTLARLLQGLKSQVVRLQYRAILLPGRAAQSMQEHEAIVAAICANSPEAAARTMKTHLDNVIKTLRRAIEMGYPQPFPIPKAARERRPSMLEEREK